MSCRWVAAIISFLSLVRTPPFYSSFKKRKKNSRFNVLVACMNDRQSQVTKLSINQHLIITYLWTGSLLPSTKIQWKRSPPDGTNLSYTDSLKNDSICTGRLYIGYLRMLCYSCELRPLVLDDKVAPDTRYWKISLELHTEYTHSPNRSQEIHRGNGDIVTQVTRSDISCKR